MDSKVNSEAVWCGERVGVAPVIEYARYVGQAMQPKSPVLYFDWKTISST
jgi:hypothetical protein